MTHTGTQESETPASGQTVLALALSIAAMAMLPFASTGTNLSFPDIESTFSGSPRSTLSWAVSGYSIAIAAFTLLGGQITDRLRGDRVFGFGLALFGGASLLVGLAPNPALLILGRVLHGMGGALIVPASLLVVTSRWPEGRHPFAIGLWTMAFPIGASFAPGLSSTILQVSSWRWVFFAVGLAAAVVALIQILALRPVPDSAPSRAIDAAQGRPDLLGVVIGSGGVGLLALGIVQGPNWGWVSPEVVVSLVLAVLSVPAFVGRSRRHPRPLVNLDIFSVRSYAVATTVNVFVSSVGAATWLLWPLLMVDEWGYDRIEVGLALTPAPVFVALFSGLSARIAETSGYRGIMLVGTALIIVGNLWFLLVLGAEPNYLGALLPGLLMHGAGLGLTFAPLNAAALSEVSPSQYGQANAAFATVRFLSNALGVAAGVAALESAGSDAMAGFDRAFALLSGLSVVGAIVVFVTWPSRPRVSLQPI